jgi:multiple sugar transport system substrate-binding protein
MGGTAATGRVAQSAAVTRRFILAGTGAALAGATGALATACSGQPGGAPGAGAKLKQGARLAATGWGGLPSSDVRAKLAAQFGTQYPGLAAEYADRDGGSYFDKLQADLAAGTTPDVYFMNPYFFTLYALRKAYLNLSPLARRDKVDLGDFYPVARQLYVYRNDQWGLPLHFNGINLLFNRPLFETSGVPLPSQDLKGTVWNFDQFLDACRRLTKRDGNDVTQWGTGLNTAFQWYLSLVYSNGGDLLNKEQTACTLTDAPAVEALQFLQDLVHRHRVAALGADLSKVGLNLNTGFSTGKVAMNWASGAPSFGTFRNTAQFAWDVGILPVGKGKPATGMGGPGYCVWRESKNPDEAWVLLNWLTNKEAQIAEVQAGTTTPSRKSVANAPEFLNQRPPEHVKVVSDTLETIKLPPQLPNWSDVQARLDAEMAPMWQGTKTAREAAGAAKQQIDPLLQEAKRLTDAAQ